MSHRFISFRNVTVFAASLCLPLVGCWRLNPSPEGVIALANSQWQFFYVVGSAEGSAFVTANFGPFGELISFESLAIPQVQDILGDAILFDEQKHSIAPLGGLVQYQAYMSGAETDDGGGFAFDGWLYVFVPILGKVATGTISATATYDPSDPDTVMGAFKLSVQVLMVSEIPGTDVNQPFIGHRVTE